MKNFWHYIENAQKEKNFKMHYESEIPATSILEIALKTFVEVVDGSLPNNGLIVALKELPDEKLQQYKTVLIQKIFTQENLLQTGEPSTEVIEKQKLKRKKQIIKEVNNFHKKIPNFTKLPAMSHTK